MALGNINKILKAIGKNGSKLVDTTISATDTGADIAKKFNEKFMKEISPEELASDFSPIKHLVKRKAKTSTNLIAFGGLTAFGAATGFKNEANSSKLGEITTGEIEGLTNTFVSPTVDNMVQEQQRNPELLQKAIQNNSNKYGSAGPDLVFALHQLRGR